jgi:hypothetical protein
MPSKKYLLLIFILVIFLTIGVSVSAEIQFTTSGNIVYSMTGSPLTPSTIALAWLEKSGSYDAANTEIYNIYGTNLTPQLSVSAVARQYLSEEQHIVLCPYNSTDYSIIWSDTDVAAGTNGITFQSFKFNPSSGTVTNTTLKILLDGTPGTNNMQLSCSALNSTAILLGQMDGDSNVIRYWVLSPSGTTIMTNVVAGVSTTYRMVSIAALNSTSFVEAWASAGGIYNQVIDISTGLQVNLTAQLLVFNYTVMTDFVSLTAFSPTLYALNIMDRSGNTLKSVILNNAGANQTGILTLDSAIGSSSGVTKIVSSSYVNSTSQIISYFDNDAGNYGIKLLNSDGSVSLSSSTPPYNSVTHGFDSIISGSYPLSNSLSGKFVVLWKNQTTTGVMQGYYINGSALGSLPNITITSPTISPSLGYYNTTLSTSTNFSSNDGSNATVTFMWYKNNTNIYNDSKYSASGIQVNSTLGISNLTRFNYYNVSVQANGTSNSSLSWSNIVYIANYPPVFNQSIPNITLSHIYNLSLKINGSDPEEDIITYGLNSSKFTLNTTTGQINFTASVKDTGNYSLAVNISDGYNVTIAYFTYQITDTMPTIAGVNITPSSPITTSNLSCNPSGVTDADGDPLGYTYDWLKNSVSQHINNSILGSGNLSVSDTWQCTLYVADGFYNSSLATSSSVSIATGYVAPTITSTRITTISTKIISNSTFPTNDNDGVNISVNFTDANSNDAHTVWFCKTDSFTSGNCSSYWGETIHNLTGLSFSFAMNVSTLTNQVYDVYIFNMDNTSLISASAHSTFNVNHRPATSLITNPLTNLWLNKNYSLITVSDSDPDSDPINMTLYSSPDNTTYIMIFNGTSGSFNYTNLNTTNYYIKALTYDSFNYYSLSYSPSILIKVDLNNPILENATISAATVSTSDVVNVYADCFETPSGVANVSYDIYDIFGVTTNHLMTWLSGNTYMDTYTPYGTPGQYNITKFYCSNNASTQTTLNSTLYFTTTTPGTIIIGGGGGAGETNTIIEGGNFSVLTDTGANSYELYISGGQCREKDIIVRNLGADPITVSAYCEGPTYSFGSACQFVNLTFPNTNTIPANNQFEYIIKTNVCLTQDISDLNQSLLFNVVVDRTDVNPKLRQSLSFKMIPQDFIGYIVTLIGKFSESWKVDLSKINPDASPLYIPKWFGILGIPILYLFIMFVFFGKVSNMLIKSFVYVLGTITIFIGALIIL